MLLMNFISSFRFASEIAGVDDLGTTGRGGSMEVELITIFIRMCCHGIVTEKNAVNTYTQVTGRWN